MSDHVEQMRTCPDTDCKAQLRVTAVKTPAHTTNKIYCPSCGEEFYMDGAGYFTNIKAVRV
jgi:uncharacterized protein YbaR (Trm112 family)